jgi:hypothetical protein
LTGHALVLAKRIYCFSSKAALQAAFVGPHRCFSSLAEHCLPRGARGEEQRMVD